MENTWETFQQAYQAAGPEIKALIDSEFLPDCVRGTIITNNLDDSLRIPILRVLSLAILKAIDETTFTAELSKLGVTNAQTIAQQLLSCGQNKLGGGNITPTTESIVGIRTMADDIQAVQAENEPTYTSTQEAILKEAAPREDSHTPQWGNEGR